jgi:hypothetical protein
MMSKANLTFLEQLQQLKAVTVRTGLIHEAQAVQLRNYPRLIPGVLKATTKVNTDDKIVYFECIPEKKQFRMNPKRLDMCNNIVKWVRTILWDDTVIVMTVDGRSFFDTRTAK